MICPLEGIRAFLPYLPRPLVSPAAAAAVEALTATLPEGMSHFGVECRLDADRGQVDFSLGVQWIDGGREALVTSLATHPSRDDPSWSTLRELCTSWSDRSSCLYFRIGGVWLEFDLDGDDAGAQPPNLFVLFGRPAKGREDHDQRFASVVAEVLERLVGARRAGALGTQVLAFADALPTGARISYLAVMLPRPGRPVRVIVSGMPGAQLTPYLARIGWRAPVAKLELLLRELSDFVTSVSFEVTDVGSRIDLELRVEPSRRSEQWPVVFDRLAKLGLASAEKCRALTAWWDWRSIPLPDGGPCVLWSTINHVKVTCAEELPLAAKTYLSAGIGIFPPDAGALLLQKPLPRSS